MPLINRSSQSIYWRIFDPIDRVRVAGISPFEGVIPPGGQVGIGFSASAFQLEIQDRPPSIIPPSRVLVPAGPPLSSASSIAPATHWNTWAGLTCG